MTEREMTCLLSDDARADGCGNRCSKCGFEAGVNRKRREAIKKFGLTKCEDGLERLIIEGEEYETRGAGFAGRETRARSGGCGVNGDVPQKPAGDAVGDAAGNSGAGNVSGAEVGGQPTAQGNSGSVDAGHGRPVCAPAGGGSDFCNDGNGTASAVSGGVRGNSDADAAEDPERRKKMIQERNRKWSERHIRMLMERRK